MTFEKALLSLMRLLIIGFLFLCAVFFATLAYAPEMRLRIVHALWLGGPWMLKASAIFFVLGVFFTAVYSLVSRGNFLRYRAGKGSLDIPAKVIEKSLVEILREKFSENVEKVEVRVLMKQKIRVHLSLRETISEERVEKEITECLAKNFYYVSPYDLIVKRSKF